MSYSIYLLRKEVKEENVDDGFFENEDRITKFTAAQFAQLRERLLLHQYILKQEESDKIEFEYPFEKHGISALLTKYYLVFNSSFSTNAIFEILMTATEFTDLEEYLVFNPQEGGWQDLM